MDKPPSGSFCFKTPQGVFVKVDVDGPSGDGIAYFRVNNIFVTNRTD